MPVRVADLRSLGRLLRLRIACPRRLSRRCPTQDRMCRRSAWEDRVSRCAGWVRPLLRDPDRGKQDCPGVYIPCQPHEHGSCTAIIVTGLLQLGGDVLADCLIVVGVHSRPRALSRVDFFLKRWIGNNTRMRWFQMILRKRKRMLRESEKCPGKMKEKRVFSKTRPHARSDGGSSGPNQFAPFQSSRGPFGRWQQSINY